MTPEQRRIYNRILREMRMELKDGTIRTILGALPQIIRLKQACFSPELFEGSANSAKLNEVRGIVEQLVRSGEKAIIFTQFEPGVRILRREFAEHNPAVVTGKINHTGPKRRAEQERFNTDDDCKLYIGTIQANQEAISLGAGTYVIMMDEEWSPSANDQAVARSAAGGLRGIAATVPVNVIKVQCEDSIEQWIDNLVESKRVLFNRTIEKDAGREMLVSKITLSDLKKMLRAA
jgi:SNF2 family DNA or RNA helicase